MCVFKTSLVSYSSALQKYFFKYTFMVSVTICSDFGTQENKVCHCFHCFPIYLPWTDGTRFHDLRFLNVEFLANFFLLIALFYCGTPTYNDKRKIHNTFTIVRRTVYYSLGILLLWSKRTIPREHVDKKRASTVSPTPFHIAFPLLSQSIHTAIQNTMK